VRYALLFILFLILLFTGSVQSQELAYRRMGSEHGITSSYVNDVISDAGGFIWVATNSGIYMYDGKQATHYSTSQGLPSNEIMRLYATPLGEVWFLSSKGHVGVIQRGKASGLSDYPQLARRQFGAILPDSMGGLWLASRDGFLFYLLGGKLLLQEQLSTRPISSFIAESTRYIWGFPVHGEQIVQIQTDSRIVKPMQLVNRNLPVLEHCYRPRLDGEGNVILHSPEGVFTFNPQLFTISQIVDSDRFKKGRAIASLSDREGANWIATESGLYRFAEDWTPSSPLATRLSGFSLNALHEDHEGNLWIGSPGSGLFFVHKAKMEWIPPGKFAGQNQICGIVAGARGEVFFGNAEGTLYRKQFDRELELFATGATGSIRKIVSNEAGEVCVATDNGLFCIQRNVGKWLLKGQRVVDVCALPDGGWAAITPRKLYLFGANGILKREVLVGSYHLVSPGLDGNSVVLVSEWGLSIYENQQSRFWMSAAIFGNQRVSGIWTDRPRQIIWVATRGAGLLGIEGNKVRYHLNDRHGLSSNAIQAIYVAPDGTLLIGTDTGLNLWNPEQDPHFIDIVDESRGLVSKYIRAVAATGDSILVGTNEGVCIFRKSTLVQEVNAPPFHLLRVSRNGIEEAGSSIRIPFGTNQLVFQFAGLSYADPTGLAYRYKMEGLDTGFQFSENGLVTYNQLPPGKYTFIATAENRKGQPSPQKIYFPVEILPAYYQTWWFTLLVALSATSLLFSVYRWRIQHVKRKEEEKNLLNRQMNELKLTALKAQMNPHFLFNSLGSIQHLINSDQKTEANTYLTKFAKLLRLILDQSDERMVSLEDTITLLKLYLEMESLRFGDAFTYDIELPEDESRKKILFAMLPPMILQPFVENAIKHGLLPKRGDARLRIRFEWKEPNFLYCEVQDNGIGREQREALKKKSQADHISKGIENTRQRLKLMNELRNNKMEFNIRDLYDSQGLPAGTRVECLIPVEV